MGETMFKSSATIRNNKNLLKTNSKVLGAFPQIPPELRKYPFLKKINENKGREF